MYTDTILLVDAPASVGKGQELVVSGSLLDVGGIAAPDETLEFEVWEGVTKHNNHDHPER